ncbi:MAG: zinc-ribbon domain-containing protein [Thermoplasmata archaeon]
MVKFCSNCGAQNPDDAYFCLRCGFRFSQNIKNNTVFNEISGNLDENYKRITCQRCGNDVLVNPTDKIVVCNNCGSALINYKDTWQNAYNHFILDNLTSKAQASEIIKNFISQKYGNIPFDDSEIMFKYVPFWLLKFTHNYPGKTENNSIEFYVPIIGIGEFYPYQSPLYQFNLSKARVINSSDNAISFENGNLDYKDALRLAIYIDTGQKIKLNLSQRKNARSTVVSKPDVLYVPVWFLRLNNIGKQNYILLDGHNGKIFSKY